MARASASDTSALTHEHTERRASQSVRATDAASIAAVASHRARARGSLAMPVTRGSAR